MRETAQERESFDRLITVSIAKAGPFVRSSLQMPHHSLSAGQLLRYWDRIHTAAVATSTARGEPRVAPTGVALFRGHFVVPTVAEAARAKAISSRPAISISHFDEGDLAVIVHGHASTVGEDDALFPELTALQRELGDGRDVTNWDGHGVYLWVTPKTLYSFARQSIEFPE